MPPRYEGGMTFSGAPARPQAAENDRPLTGRFSALGIHTEAPPVPNQP
jgi:hypothetical protein